MSKITAKKWLAIAIIAIVIVVAAVLLPRAPVKRQQPAALPFPMKAPILSRPQTVATLAKESFVSRYASLSWLNKDTLVIGYEFDSRLIRRPLGPGIPKCLLGGVVGVDIRTGEAKSIHPPRPVGRSPHTIRDWGDRAVGGKLASVRIPPVKMGDGGAISFQWPMPSEVNDRIAYNVEVVGPDGKPLINSPRRGLWISRSDGSQAKQVVSWPARPLEWSPDGKTLLFRPARPTSRTGLWACRADGGGVRQLAPEFVYSAQVSPDSQRVAFATEKGFGLSLHLTDLKGGPQTLFVPDAGHPAWVGGSLLCIAERERERFNIRNLLPKRMHPKRIRERVQSVEAIDLATGMRAIVERLCINETHIDLVKRQATLVGPREMIWPVLGSKEYFQPAFGWMMAPGTDTGMFVMVGADWPKPEYTVCAPTRDGLQRVPLKGDILWPAWSPDGRRLAHIEGAKIQVVDVALKRVKRP